MLRTDAVIKLLKKNKTRMSFDDIWTNVKEDTMKSTTVDFEEAQVKADLYMSMLEDQALLMVGDNNWDLKENFSFDEANQIVKTRMTEELELDIGLEESDDTKELKLEKLVIGEDE